MAYEKTMKELLPSQMPVHIGFIMDGNGRWAKKRGFPRKFGHREGAKSFERIVNYCKDIGIQYISFYAFSTENWKRPKDEVEAIINLFRKYIDDVREHIDDNVKVVFLGDKSVFDDELRRKMIKLENDSKDFTAMTLLIAVNYGGRDEIVRAVKKIAEQAKGNQLDVSTIDDELFSRYLDTRGVPDVDLLIRPSGEMRLSNFLVWQCAYAEFYFTNVLWPDFSPKELDKAILDYSKRGRRFGGV
ncbi:MAG TPA: isoprenyl transferase [Clostridiales bacterium]|nr:isoprenyl transferase [Clostridiales bacterium]